MPVFTDAEHLAKEWINSLTVLVGAGKPLAKGVHLNPLHGDQVAHAEIQVTGGDAALSAENPDHRASVSFLVYGRTREAAARAAVALANALQALTGAQPVPVGDDMVLLADNVSAPNWSPDGPAPRYLVDCDLYLRAG
jgi:hypothetical protein